MAAGMEMLAGGALLLLMGGVTGEWLRFDPARVVPHSVIAWVYLTVFGSLVGFTAYVWLLNATTAARASTYAYVNPIVAVILGWAFKGEPITPRVLLAATAIILAVVIIVTRSTEAPVET
jgi:drug/metabolite transporter (DMT)-like permease